MKREYLENIKSENRIDRIRLIMPTDPVIGGQPTDNEGEFTSNTPLLDLACTMKFAVDEIEKNKTGVATDLTGIKEALDTKASTEYVDQKFDNIKIPEYEKTKILQELGDQTDATISQKAITDEFEKVREAMATEIKIDLTGYATEKYVDDKIKNLQEVDLSEYATKEDLQESLKDIDLSDYATKTELETSLQTMDLSGYALKKDLDLKIDKDAIVHELGESKENLISEFGAIQAFNELGADIDVEGSKKKVVSQYAITRLIEDMTPDVDDDGNGTGYPDLDGYMTVVTRSGSVKNIPIPATGNIDTAGFVKVLAWGKAPYSKTLTIHSSERTTYSTYDFIYMPKKSPIWLGNWSYLFQKGERSNFCDVNITGWETEHVVNVDNLFYTYVPAIYFLDLSNWYFPLIPNIPDVFKKFPEEKRPHFGVYPPAKKSKAEVRTFSMNTMLTVDDLTQSEINQRDIKYLQFCIDDAIESGYEIDNDKLERLRKLYIEENEQDNLSLLNKQVSEYQIERDAIQHEKEQNDEGN